MNPVHNSAIILRIKNQERSNVILSVARRAKSKDLVAVLGGIPRLRYASLGMTKRSVVFFVSFLFLIFLQPVLVGAQGQSLPAGNELQSSGPQKEGTGAGSELPPLYNPVGEETTVQGLLGRGINAVLGVVGSLALVIFVYAGIRWMTSAGNEEQALHAAKMMIWASIGLVVIFASYVLLNFVLGLFK